MYHRVLPTVWSPTCYLRTLPGSAFVAALAPEHLHDEVDIFLQPLGSMCEAPGTRKPLFCEASKRSYKIYEPRAHCGKWKWTSPKSIDVATINKGIATSSLPLLLVAMHLSLVAVTSPNFPHHSSLAPHLGSPLMFSSTKASSSFCSAWSSNAPSHYSHALHAPG